MKMVIIGYGVKEEESLLFSDLQKYDSFRITADVSVTEHSKEEADEPVKYLLYDDEIQQHKKQKIIAMTRLIVRQRMKVLIFGTLIEKH